MGKKLIPVRERQFRAASDRVRSVKGNFDDLLAGKEFNDLCLFTEDAAIKEQLEAMQVEPMTPAEIREIVNQISATLSLEKRAKIIYALVDNDLIEDGEGPALLLDQDSRVIPATNIKL